jgi:hypothetical protein
MFSRQGFTFLNANYAAVRKHAIGDGHSVAITVIAALAIVTSTPKSAGCRDARALWF